MTILFRVDANGGGSGGRTTLDTNSASVRPQSSPTSGAPTPANATGARQNLGASGAVQNAGEALRGMQGQAQNPSQEFNLRNLATQMPAYQQSGMRALGPSQASTYTVNDLIQKLRSAPNRPRTTPNGPHQEPRLQALRNIRSRIQAQIQVDIHGQPVHSARLGIVNDLERRILDNQDPRPEDFSALERQLHWAAAREGETRVQTQGRARMEALWQSHESYRLAQEPAEANRVLDQIATELRAHGRGATPNVHDPLSAADRNALLVRVIRAKVQLRNFENIQFHLRDLRAGVQQEWDRNTVAGRWEAHALLTEYSQLRQEIRQNTSAGVFNALMLDDPQPADEAVRGHLPEWFNLVAMTARLQQENSGAGNLNGRVAHFLQLSRAHAALGNPVDCLASVGEMEGLLRHEGQPDALIRGLVIQAYHDAHLDGSISARVQGWLQADERRIGRLNPQQRYEMLQNWASLASGLEEVGASSQEVVSHLQQRVGRFSLSAQANLYNQLFEDLSRSQGGRGLSDRLKGAILAPLHEQLSNPRTGYRDHIAIRELLIAHSDNAQWIHESVADLRSIAASHGFDDAQMLGLQGTMIRGLLRERGLLEQARNERQQRGEDVQADYRQTNALTQEARHLIAEYRQNLISAREGLGDPQSSLNRDGHGIQVLNSHYQQAMNLAYELDSTFVNDDLQEQLAFARGETPPQRPPNFRAQNIYGEYQQFLSSIPAPARVEGLVGTMRSLAERGDTTRLREVFAPMLRQTLGEVPEPLRVQALIQLSPAFGELRRSLEVRAEQTRPGYGNAAADAVLDERDQMASLEAGLWQDQVDHSSNAALREFSRSMVELANGHPETSRNILQGLLNNPQFRNASDPGTLQILQVAHSAIGGDVQARTERILRVVQSLASARQAAWLAEGHTGEMAAIDHVYRDLPRFLSTLPYDQLPNSFVEALDRYAAANADNARWVRQFEGAISRIPLQHVGRDGHCDGSVWDLIRSLDHLENPQQVRQALQQLRSVVHDDISWDVMSEEGRGDLGAPLQDVAEMLLEATPRGEAGLRDEIARLRHDIPGLEEYGQWKRETFNYRTALECAMMAAAGYGATFAVEAVMEQVAARWLAAAARGAPELLEGLQGLSAAEQAMSVSSRMAARSALRQAGMGLGDAQLESMLGQVLGAQARYRFGTYVMRTTLHSFAFNTFNSITPLMLGHEGGEILRPSLDMAGDTMINELMMSPIAGILPVPRGMLGGILMNMMHHSQSVLSFKIAQNIRHQGILGVARMTSGYQALEHELAQAERLYRLTGNAEHQARAERIRHHMEEITGHAPDNSLQGLMGDFVRFAGQGLAERSLGISHGHPHEDHEMERARVERARDEMVERVVRARHEREAEGLFGEHGERREAIRREAQERFREDGEEAQRIREATRAEVEREVDAEGAQAEGPYRSPPSEARVEARAQERYRARLEAERARYENERARTEREHFVERHPQRNHEILFLHGLAEAGHLENYSPEQLRGIVDAAERRHPSSATGPARGLTPEAQAFARHLLDSVPPAHLRGYGLPGIEMVGRVVDEAMPARDENSSRRNEALLIATLQGLDPLEVFGHSHPEAHVRERVQEARQHLEERERAMREALAGPAPAPGMGQRLNTTPAAARPGLQIQFGMGTQAREAGQSPASDAPRPTGRPGVPGHVPHPEARSNIHLNPPALAAEAPINAFGTEPGSDAPARRGQPRARNRARGLGEIPGLEMNEAARRQENERARAARRGASQEELRVPVDGAPRIAEPREGGAERLEATGRKSDDAPPESTGAQGDTHSGGGEGDAQGFEQGRQGRDEAPAPQEAERPTQPLHRNAIQASAGEPPSNIPRDDAVTRRPPNVALIEQLAEACVDLMNHTREVNLRGALDYLERMAARLEESDPSFSERLREDVAVLRDDATEGSPERLAAVQRLNGELQRIEAFAQEMQNRPEEPVAPAAGDGSTAPSLPRHNPTPSFEVRVNNLAPELRSIFQERANAIGEAEATRPLTDAEFGAHAAERMRNLLQQGRTQEARALLAWAQAERSAQTPLAESLAEAIAVHENFAAPAARPSEPVAPAAAVTTPRDVAWAKAQKVLIVDDEAAIARGFRRSLTGAGHTQVETANSGFDAIEHVRANSDVAIITMDQGMPGMSGVEAALALRSAGFLGPIIFITGEQYPPDVEAIGNATVLCKPIDPVQLSSLLVERLIEHAASPSGRANDRGSNTAFASPHPVDEPGAFRAHEEPLDGSARMAQLREGRAGMPSLDQPGLTFAGLSAEPRREPAYRDRPTAASVLEGVTAEQLRAPEGRRALIRRLLDSRREAWNADFAVTLERLQSENEQERARAVYHFQSVIPHLRGQQRWVAFVALFEALDSLSGYDRLNASMDCSNLLGRLGREHAVEAAALLLHEIENPRAEALSPSCLRMLGLLMANENLPYAQRRECLRVLMTQARSESAAFARAAMKSMALAHPRLPRRQQGEVRELIGLLREHSYELIAERARELYVEIADAQVSAKTPGPTAEIFSEMRSPFDAMPDPAVDPVERHRARVEGRDGLASVDSGNRDGGGRIPEAARPENQAQNREGGAAEQMRPEIREGHPDAEPQETASPEAPGGLVRPESSAARLIRQVNAGAWDTVEVREHRGAAALWFTLAAALGAAARPGHFERWARALSLPLARGLLALGMSPEGIENLFIHPGLSARRVSAREEAGVGAYRAGRVSDPNANRLSEPRQQWVRETVRSFSRGKGALEAAARQRSLALGHVIEEALVRGEREAQELGGGLQLNRKVEVLEYLRSAEGRQLLHVILFGARPLHNPAEGLRVLMTQALRANSKEEARAILLECRRRGEENRTVHLSKGGSEGASGLNALLDYATHAAWEGRSLEGEMFLEVDPSTGLFRAVSSGREHIDAIDGANPMRRVALAFLSNAESIGAARRESGFREASWNTIREYMEILGRVPLAPVIESPLLPLLLYHGNPEQMAWASLARNVLDFLRAEQRQGRTLNSPSFHQVLDAIVKGNYERMEMDHPGFPALVEATRLWWFEEVVRRHTTGSPNDRSRDDRMWAALNWTVGRMQGVDHATEAEAWRLQLQEHLEDPRFSAYREAMSGLLRRLDEVFPRPRSAEAPARQETTAVAADPLGEALGRFAAGEGNAQSLREAFYAAWHDTPASIQPAHAERLARELRGNLVPADAAVVAHVLVQLVCMESRPDLRAAIARELQSMSDSAASAVWRGVEMHAAQRNIEQAYVPFFNLLHEMGEEGGNLGNAFLGHLLEARRAPHTDMEHLSLIEAVIARANRGEEWALQMLQVAVFPRHQERYAPSVEMILDSVRRSSPEAVRRAIEYSARSGYIEPGHEATSSLELPAATRIRVETPEQEGVRLAQEAREAREAQTVREAGEEVVERAPSVAPGRRRNGPGEGGLYTPTGFSVAGLGLALNSPAVVGAGLVLSALGLGAHYVGAAGFRRAYSIAAEWARRASARFTDAILPREDSFGHFAQSLTQPESRHQWGLWTIMVRGAQWEAATGTLRVEATRLEEASEGIRSALQAQGYELSPNGEGRWSVHRPNSSERFTLHIHEVSSGGNWEPRVPLLDHPTIGGTMRVLARRASLESGRPEAEHYAEMRALIEQAQAAALRGDALSPEMASARQHLMRLNHLVPGWEGMRQEEIDAVVSQALAGLGTLRAHFQPRPELTAEQGRLLLQVAGDPNERAAVQLSDLLRREQGDPSLRRHPHYAGLIEALVRQARDDIRRDSDADRARSLERGLDGLLRLNGRNERGERATDRRNDTQPIPLTERRVPSNLIELRRSLAEDIPSDPRVAERIQRVSAGDRAELLRRIYSGEISSGEQAIAFLEHPDRRLEVEESDLLPAASEIYLDARVQHRLENLVEEERTEFVRRLRANEFDGVAQATAYLDQPGRVWDLGEQNLGWSGEARLPEELRPLYRELNHVARGSAEPFASQAQRTLREIANLDPASPAYRSRMEAYAAERSRLARLLIPEYGRAISDLRDHLSYLRLEGQDGSANPAPYRIVRVDIRLKDAEDIVPKLTRRGWDDMSGFFDLGGARVIVRNQREAAALASEIAGWCAREGYELHPEDIQHKHSPSGYRAVHLNVRRNGQPVAEVQIQTPALEAWNRIEHQLVYKNPALDAQLPGRPGQTYRDLMRAYCSAASDFLAARENGAENASRPARVPEEALEALPERTRDKLRSGIRQMEALMDRVGGRESAPLRPEVRPAEELQEAARHANAGEEAPLRGRPSPEEARVAAILENAPERQAVPPPPPTPSMPPHESVRPAPLGEAPRIEQTAFDEMMGALDRLLPDENPAANRGGERPREAEDNDAAWGLMDHDAGEAAPRTTEERAWQSLQGLMGEGRLNAEYAERLMDSLTRDPHHVYHPTQIEDALNRLRFRLEGGMNFEAALERLHEPLFTAEANSDLALRVGRLTERFSAVTEENGSPPPAQRLRLWFVVAAHLGRAGVLPEFARQIAAANAAIDVGALRQAVIEHESASMALRGNDSPEARRNLEQSRRDLESLLDTLEAYEANATRYESTDGFLELSAQSPGANRESQRAQEEAIKSLVRRLRDAEAEAGRTRDGAPLGTLMGIEGPLPHLPAIPPVVEFAAGGGAFRVRLHRLHPEQSEARARALAEQMPPDLQQAFAAYFARHPDSPLDFENFAMLANRCRPGSTAGEVAGVRRVLELSRRFDQAPSEFQAQGEDGRPNGHRIRLTGEILGIGSGRTVFAGVAIDASGTERPVAVKMGGQNLEEEARTIGRFQAAGVDVQSYGFIRVPNLATRLDGRVTLTDAGRVPCGVESLARGELVRGFQGIERLFEDAAARERIGDALASDIARLTAAGNHLAPVPGMDCQWMVEVDGRAHWIDLESYPAHGDPARLSAQELEARYESARLAAGLPLSYRGRYRFERDAQGAWRAVSNAPAPEASRTLPDMAREEAQQVRTSVESPRHVGAEGRVQTFRVEGESSPISPPREVLGEDVYRALLGNIPEGAAVYEVNASDHSRLQAGLRALIDSIPASQLPCTIYTISHLQGPAGSCMLALVERRISEESGRRRAEIGEQMFNFLYEVDLQGPQPRIVVDFMRVAERIRDQDLAQRAALPLVEYAARRYPGARIETAAVNIISARFMGMHMEGARVLRIEDLDRHGAPQPFGRELLERIRDAGARVLTAEQAADLVRLGEACEGSEAQKRAAIAELQARGHIPFPIQENRIDSALKAGIHNLFGQNLRENFQRAQASGETSARNEIAFFFEGLRAVPGIARFLRANASNTGGLWIEGRLPGAAEAAGQGARRQDPDNFVRAPEIEARFSGSRLPEAERVGDPEEQRWSMNGVVASQGWVDAYRQATHNSSIPDPQVIPTGMFFALSHSGATDAVLGFLRSKGARTQGLTFLHTGEQVRYLRPARAGEALNIEIEMLGRGSGVTVEDGLPNNRSLLKVKRTFRNAAGEVVAECVSTFQFRPRQAIAGNPIRSFPPAGAESRPGAVHPSQIDGFAQVSGDHQWVHDPSEMQSEGGSHAYLHGMASFNLAEAAIPGEAHFPFEMSASFSLPVFSGDVLSVREGLGAYEVRAEGVQRPVARASRRSLDAPADAPQEAQASSAQRVVRRVLPLRDATVEQAPVPRPAPPPVPEAARQARRRVVRLGEAAAETPPMAEAARGPMPEAPFRSPQAEALPASLQHLGPDGLNFLQAHPMPDPFAHLEASGSSEVTVGIDFEANQAILNPSGPNQQPFFVIRREGAGYRVIPHVPARGMAMPVYIGGEAHLQIPDEGLVVAAGPQALRVGVGMRVNLQVPETPAARPPVSPEDATAHVRPPARHTPDYNAENFGPVAAPVPPSPAPRSAAESSSPERRVVQAPPPPHGPGAEVIPQQGVQDWVLGHLQMGGVIGADTRVFQDPTVARQHCTVERNPDGSFFVQNIGDQRTFIVHANGRLEPVLQSGAQVRHGQVIQVGQTRLRLVGEGRAVQEYRDPSLTRPPSPSRFPLNFQRGVYQWNGVTVRRSGTFTKNYSLEVDASGQMPVGVNEGGQWRALRPGERYVLRFRDGVSEEFRLGAETWRIDRSGTALLVSGRPAGEGEVFQQAEAQEFRPSLGVFNLLAQASPPRSEAERQGMHYANVDAYLAADGVWYLRNRSLPEHAGVYIAPEGTAASEMMTRGRSVPPNSHIPLRHGQMILVRSDMGILHYVRFSDPRLPAGAGRGEPVSEPIPMDAVDAENVVLHRAFSAAQFEVDLERSGLPSYRNARGELEINLEALGLDANWRTDAQWSQPEPENYGGIRAFSHRGIGGKNHNEDRYAVVQTQDGRSIALVIDGMGGHAGGERAAEIARRVAQVALNAGQSLEHAIALANRAVRQDAARGNQAQNPIGDAIAVAVELRPNHYAYIEPSNPHARNSPARVIGNGDSLALVLDLNAADAVVYHSERPRTSTPRMPLNVQRDASGRALRGQTMVIRTDPNANRVDHGLKLDGHFDIDQPRQELRPGQLVLVGCDGFFENYGSHDIIADVLRVRGARTSDQALAVLREDVLVRQALLHLARQAGRPLQITPELYASAYALAFPGQQPPPEFYQMYSQPSVRRNIRNPDGGLRRGADGQVFFDEHLGPFFVNADGRVSNQAGTPVDHFKTDNVTLVVQEVGLPVSGEAIRATQPGAMPDAPMPPVHAVQASGPSSRDTPVDPNFLQAHATPTSPVSAPIPPVRQRIHRVLGQDARPAPQAPAPEVQTAPALTPSVSPVLVDLRSPVASRAIEVRDGSPHVLAQGRRQVAQVERGSQGLNVRDLGHYETRVRRSPGDWRRLEVGSTHAIRPGDEICIGDPNGRSAEKFRLENEGGVLRLVRQAEEAPPEFAQAARSGVQVQAPLRGPLPIAPSAASMRREPPLPRNSVARVERPSIPFAQLKPGKSLVLGREADVRVGQPEDRTVSRRHATLVSSIQREEQTFSIRAGAYDSRGQFIPSANGVHVFRNGVWHDVAAYERSQGRRDGSAFPLQEGDFIRLGGEPGAGFYWHPLETERHDGATIMAADWKRNVSPAIGQGEDFIRSHRLEGELHNGLEIPGRGAIFIEGVGVREIDAENAGEAGMREIIYWDRSQDRVASAFLDQVAERVRSEMGIRQLNPNHPEFERQLDRALRIFCRELRRNFRRPGESSQQALARLREFSEQRRGQPALVGEILQNGFPFCRHLALVTQAFLVDLGVRNVAMQRGRVPGGAHVWNEAEIGGQARRIIEITSPFWSHGDNEAVLQTPGTEVIYSPETRPGNVVR